MCVCVGGGYVRMSVYVCLCVCVKNIKRSFNTESNNITFDAFRRRVVKSRSRFVYRLIYLKLTLSWIIVTINTIL